MIGIDLNDYTEPEESGDSVQSASEESGEAAEDEPYFMYDFFRPEEYDASLQYDCVPTREAAIDLAKTVLLENIDPNWKKEFIVCEIGYDEKEEIWIVFFYDKNELGEPG